MFLVTKDRLFKQIRELREARGLTQKQALKPKTVAYTTLQAIDKGDPEANPTIETLQNIASNLDANFEIYIGEVPSLKALGIAEKRLELIELISQIPADKLNDVIALANDFIAEVKALSVRDVPGTKPS